MKKNRSSDKPAANFKNSPFHRLKKLDIRSSPSKSEPRPKRSVSSSAEPEDAEALFLRAAAGAKKLEDGEEQELSSPEARKNGAVQPAPSDEREEQLRFLEAMRKMGPMIREERSDEDEDLPHRQSSSSRMRQLKRGTIRISEELDLHGCLKEEALVRLRHFIGAAYRRGHKAVLVITGKGINSPDGPVLPGAVSAWLRGNGKELVAEFSPAPRDKGGSGALVVFLKSRK